MSEPKLKADEPGLPSFDPRPWPIVVLMLAGLFGVYFGLRPRPEGAGGPKAVPATAPVTRPATTTRGAASVVDEGAGARLAAGVVAPGLVEEKERFEQGVTLTFEQGGKTDARAARVLSLRVPEGTAPTPLLKAGAFKATWSGFVNLRLRGEYTFSVLGRGKVGVRIGGKTVLEADGEDSAGKASLPVRMEKGRNAVEVVYEPPAKGDAWVRVLWESREFPAEPVQPGVLSHDVSARALREGMRVREGRELVGTLRCAKCHALPKWQLPEGAVAMPELAADAPNLGDAGARLKRGWMAAWIADPKAMRPDASMPKVLHGENVAAGAGDLAAYLATLGKAAEDGAGVKYEEEQVKEGGQVFAGLGCVACHTKPDVEEVDKEHGRVPLKWVNAKFQPGALKRWLLEPQAHYAWTRMPDFRLSELEADRLVAYLVTNAKGEVAEEAQGDAEKGRALFASAGCGNCHAVGGGSTPQAEPLNVFAKSIERLIAESDWTRGCLGADEAARGKAPEFGLSDGQRDALRAFAAGGVGSLANDAMPEVAERAVRQLQCVACHGRDEVEDRWSAVGEEVAELMPPETNIESDQTEDAAAAKGPRLFVQRGLGKLHGGDRIAVAGDQSRPTLTWAGDKLRAEWMGRFIAGEVGYKPRYWLRARMPAFHGERAKTMAAGMALEHGMPTASAATGNAEPGLAEVGRKLVGTGGGFACVTCHSVADVRAQSPFEAPAPNLVHVSERLTHDFYLRWMRKPMRFQPGTKMPQYSEGGRTSLGDVLGGEADRQFEAIWQYVLQGERMAPPE